MDASETPSGQAPAAESPQSDSYYLLGRRTQEQSQGLFQLGSLAVVAAAAYFFVTADVEDPLHLYIGELIFILSVIPGLLWLKQGGSRFPAFEPILLLCANAYAVPLMTGQRQLALFDPDVITWAGFAVLSFQGSAIAAYTMVRGQPGRSRFWRESVLGDRIQGMVAYGIVLSTAYIAFAQFTDIIPGEIGSVLRAVFYGISILCTFVTAQRWGRGELTRPEQRIFLSFLAIQLLLMSSGLLLIEAITLSGIAILAYLSSGRRVPWIAVICLFAVFAILHNGKTRMRQIYWEGLRAPPTITELPAFFSEWVGYGLSRHGSDDSASVGAKLLERTSLLHILCLVVDYTPRRQPYLQGETYGYVLPQLVPRLFWPDKPRSHIATYRLAVYYGLQDEDATRRTTIAFGMVAEAYANFGIVGTALLGVVIGGVYKKLQLLSTHSPMFSLAGLTMILLTAWSLNSELTMAAWVSSFYQALIAVLGTPLLMRTAFGF